MANFEHSVASRLDYGFDWATGGWLSHGETLTSSDWVISGTDGVLDSPQSIYGVTSVFVTLTSNQTMYKLTNTVHTSGGRVDSRTHTIYCIQR